METIIHKPVKNTQELLDYLKGINLSEMQYELESLLAIKTWSKKQLHIHEGDKVSIARLVINRDSGWWIYRLALADHQTGVAGKIDFNNTFSYWYAEVILDNEFSVDDNNVVVYKSLPGGKHIFNINLDNLHRIVL